MPRQIVLAGRSNGTTAEPLGARDAVLDQFARCNTAPDGSPADAQGGMSVLYGPGMIVELPRASESVAQALVTITDEDLAWPVLLRLCQRAQWSMVDLETGRRFG